MSSKQANRVEENEPGASRDARRSARGARSIRLSSRSAWSGSAAAVAIGVIACTAPVSAVPAPSPESSFSAPKPNKPAITNVEFGWHGSMPAERWAPVRVWISGGDRGFTGTISMRFAQDTTQDALVSVPAAAAPGEIRPVEIIANFPSWVEKIEFEMLRDGWRSVGSVTVDRYPTGGAPGLTNLVDPSPGLVLNIGARGLTEFLSTVRVANAATYSGNFENRTRTPAQVAEERWSMLRLQELRPIDLSTSWTAYDGAEILIVQGGQANAVSPDAMTAVHSWVLAGGRIVIVADTAGGAWRQWLPEGADAGSIELNDAVPIPAPDGFESMITEARAAYLERLNAQDKQLEPIASDSPGALREITDQAWAPAPRVFARLVSVPPKAARRGWRVTHDLRGVELPTVPASEITQTTSGLVASGPVGFGHATVIGFNPLDVTTGKLAPAAAPVWKHLLVQPLSSWLTESAESPYYGFGWGYQGSGDGAAERTAIRGTLDSIVDALKIRDFSFGGLLVIGILTLLLALAVGPVDAIVLKKLAARHRAWLSGIGWIGLAALAAWWTPLLLRMGEKSGFGRVEAVDILQEPTAPGDNLPRALAWRAGVSAFFSTSPGSYELNDVGGQEWWRGVSPVSSFERARGAGLSALRSAQQTDVSSLGIARGNPILDLSQGQWLLRSLADETKASTTIRASIDTRGPTPSVELFGLPQDAVITTASLLLENRWWRLDFPQTADGMSRRAVAVSDSHSAKERETWLFLSTDARQLDFPFVDTSGQQPLRARPAHALMLPGAARRTGSIETRSALGAYATVYVRTSEGAEAAAAPGAAASRNAGPSIAGINTQLVRVYRILVPLDAGENAP
jgi:hypothetical protein